MNNTKKIPCYMAHLLRFDGQPIDTDTGTQCFEHAYRKRTGKPYTVREVTRRFNKRQNWLGYYVDRVEVFYFSKP